MTKISDNSPANTLAGKLSCVAIYGKSFKAPRSMCVLPVVEALRRLGVEILIESQFVEVLACQGDVADIAGLPRFDGYPEGAEIAISIGGDGTFLRTAEKLGNRQIPILGINAGRLGFLADVAPECAEEALQQVVAGEFAISKRSLIEVKAEGEEIGLYPFALNEIAVLKHDNSSLIEVETYVDGQLLTNYMADGLIVSTPTGSTGYALSVGGPVIAPESPAFCLAPVAPHSLAMRPVVLSDKGVLTLSVKSRTGRFLLSVDGRSQSLTEGVRLTLRKAGYCVEVVKTEGNDFFHTLRNKMMWGVDQRV